MNLQSELSLRRRIAYVLVGLAGLGGAVFVGALWLTEPGLAPRTSVVFAVLVLIGLAWAAYAGWALTRRAPLYARDRVIAAWLGLGATGLVAVAIVALRQRFDLAPLVMVGTLLVVAVVNLVRARGHYQALLRRKRELEG